MICASLGRVELHLGRRMPRAEPLWPVHKWLIANRLHVNVDKTNIMVFPKIKANEMCV